MSDNQDSQPLEHTEKRVCPDCGAAFKVEAGQKVEDVHSHDKQPEPKGAKDESARPTKDSPDSEAAKDAAKRPGK